MTENIAQRKTRKGPKIDMDRGNLKVRTRNTREWQEKANKEGGEGYP